MNAIETFNLTKIFRKSPALGELLIAPFRKRQKITALKDITITVNRGTLFGLLGLNGAGKTTLVKMLSTLIMPTAGSAVVNGYDIVKEDAQVRESIGLVTGEERGFYWRLTGRQNLEFFAALYGLSGKRAKEKINSIFHLIELEEKKDSYVKEYSTGMKQRLAIGKALLNNPSILFLDEPTNSLDVVASRNMRRFISKTLVDDLGKTVVLTSHRMEEVDKLCNRIAIIDNGELRFSGEVSDLKAVHASLEKAFIEIISKERYTG